MRPRRSPITELPALLEAVAEATDELREAEDALTRAREQQRKAIRKAHRGGASYALLGRISGYSRQHVATIVSDQG